MRALSPYTTQSGSARSRIGVPLPYSCVRGAGSVAGAVSVSSPSGRPGAGKLRTVRVQYQKLVRDRIPEIVQSHGAHPVTRVLDKESYPQALLAKLLEGAHEAIAARPAELPGELADVLDVVRALAAVHGLTWDQLLDIAAAKRITNGAFRQRLFLEHIDQPDTAPPEPAP